MKFKNALKHFYRKKSDFKDLYKIMRISLFLLFAFTFQMMATNTKAQEAVVELKSTSTTVGKLLSEIEKQTDYLVVYSNREVDTSRKINVKNKSGKVSGYLNEVFADTDIDYDFENNYIVLAKRASKNASMISEMIEARTQQQGKTITGKVVDVNGEPIIGATIVVQGDASKGTVTDYDGKFALSNIPENAVLEISYVGMKTQVVETAGRNLFNISLEEDREMLDELVVVGYGVQRRSDLTGAITSVGKEIIELIPSTNVINTLQGQVPGLLASTTNWDPGDSPQLLIRGKRSITASNEPLFIVDGIPMTSGINGLSQHDIESIEVLKDASATAIYGSRGANGVILISTKQGSEGRTIIDYNASVGIQSVQNRVEMMNGGEYAEYTREAYRNSTRANRYLSDYPDIEQDKLLPMFKQDSYVLESVLMGYDEHGNYNPDNVRWHDWFSDVIQSALITNHSVNIRGGNKKTNFMSSVSYNFTDGVLKDKNYERYTIRLNLNHQINDFIKLGIQSQYADYNQQRGSGLERDSYQYRITPLGRFVNEDGSLPMLIGADAQMYNPMLNFQTDAIDRPLKTNQYLANFFVELNLPIDGLNFRSNYALDFRSVQDYEYFAKETTPRQNGTSYAKNSTLQNNMYSWENYFTYNKDLNSKHRINLTLLQSIQQDVNESNLIAVENLPSNSLKFYDLGAGLLINKIGSDYLKWNLASFMGRINYNISDRYLFTISARYDGASRLAEGHKWVLFPSSAFAWRIIEEPFMQGNNFFSNLKLRLGYGRTGNSAIDPYQTKGVIGKRYYVYGNGATEVIGYSPLEMMNDELTWETTGQFNGGFDMGFLKNRVNLTIDYYLQNTYDLLLERQLPAVSGFTSVMSNIGKTQNKGLEVALDIKSFDNKNFFWKTDLIFSHNQQKIIELYNGKIDDVGNQWFIGSPTDVYFDYKKIGIWQNTPEDLTEIAKFNANGSGFAPGEIKLLDLDGDYKITDKDRVVLGQRYPKIMISLNNYLKYRDFDLSFLLYSNLGGMMKNTFEFMEKPGRANALRLIDYWTPDNPTNDFPRPSVDQERVNYSNTLGYDKTDFIRVRNLTLGYSLPKKMSEGIGIDVIRFYLSANNPYIYTKFSGIDPEGASGETSPSVSTWMFGFNLTF